MKQIFTKQRILFLVLLLSNMLYSQQEGTGILKGIVKAAEDGEKLPYASLIIVGTTLGASTDFEGNYIIRNIPAGKQTVRVSFVGYESQSREVNIQNNKIVELDISLPHVTIQGKEVVVQAQAAGQIAAINQQLSSNSIVNVVSSARIQEVPDANAAESVGRLPGVSIQRVGGEGNKVVIRGLSPKFSAINVNGVRMAATGSGDRSTDISMISPYMLEGIEVMKALTPDKDADVIGGSVDFKLREAPNKSNLNAQLQGGYNGMSKEYKDYKFVLGGNRRFFDNQFGLFAQMDIESRDRSSDELSAGFEIVNPVLGKKNQVTASNATFLDFLRKKQRYGGSLVLDYRYDLGKIKLGNFYSYIKNDVTRRSESFNSSTNEHTYYMAKTNNEMTVVSNSFDAEHDLGFIKLDGSLSGSFSQNKVPQNTDVTFTEGAAFVGARGIENPFDLVKAAKNDISNTYINQITSSSSYTKESEFSGALNANYDLELTSDMSAKFKFGGKIRHKEKYNDENAKYREFQPYAYARQTILERMPWLKNAATGSADVSKLPYAMFIDKNYSVSDFLKNQFTFGPTTNFDLIYQMYDIFESVKDTYRPGVTGSMMWNDFQGSLQNDYNGTEDYKAGYVMTSVNLADNLTFMPGARYEYNKTNYTANRGDNSLERERGYNHHDTTYARTEDFFLPMVHLKYTPFPWLIIRTAFTKSLSRPNYGQIIPSYYMNITSGILTYNNYDLKSALSTNFDLLFSVLENKVGLFSVGLFYKKIENLVYNTGRIANLDPAGYNVPNNLKPQYIQTFLNNENKAEVMGVEVDWQTNFWYLPSPLNGLVLTLNYTHINSKTQYPKIEVKNVVVGYDTLFGGVIIVPRTEMRNIKSTFEGRIIDQPDDIINVSLGYDYKGFSSRLSMQYQDDILTGINFWEELRSSTDTYVRWDFTASQKLPIDGLQVFFNLNNITTAVDKALISGSKYPVSEEHYGMTGDIGIRYSF